MNKYLFFLFIFLSLSMISSAQEANVTAEEASKIATEYYNKKDYTEALKWYRIGAEQGHAKSQNAIGVMYYNGNGVKKDFAEAVKWYRKSADQGFASAQYNLGVMYENGYGVTEDYTKAVNWYRKAAEQGHVKAQNNLGGMYERGNGVPQDYQTAREWYQKSLNIDPNYALAKDNLAKIEKKIAEQSSSNYAQPPTTTTQPKAETKPVQQIASVPTLPKVTVSDVDKHIPVSGQTDKNTFVVVIGNEKYEEEADVPFAENDAKIFAEYCHKTLGISEKHIRSYVNAGYNDIRKAVSWLKQGLSAYEGKGRVIFYYAGHGIPNEADKSAYLLPVDGIGSDIESAYSLNKLYHSLSELPAKSVLVFLDACFSGAKREGGMMASARGVAIKARPEDAKGKMVIFTAAQGDETAYPFKSQQHGLFTYYLLKILSETKGQVTLGELGDYLRREVKRESFDENNKIQTPSVNASSALANSWRSMKLR